MTKCHGCGRRMFLRGVVAGAAGVALPCLAGAARVGVVRCGGKGVPGVVVTDGLNCTLTEENGSFSLPGRPSARFLSVTVPSGFRAKGGVFYRAVSAESHDFELERFEESACSSCCRDRKSVV